MEGAEAEGAEAKDVKAEGAEAEGTEAVGPKVEAAKMALKSITSDLELDCHVSPSLLVDSFSDILQKNGKKNARKLV